MSMTLQNSENVVKVYRKRAKRYDFTANLYYLLGFREWAYRKKAVRALELQPGDTVVEIGCGTGLNFSLLQQAVGPEGKIIGVDLTDAMLAQARKRVQENKWPNVELVHSNAATFPFPSRVDGIISTFVLSLVPEFDKVIQNGCEVLLPGKRWVVLGLKLPSNWPSWLVTLAFLSERPFVDTTVPVKEAINELARRRPWESINKYLKNTTFTEFYMGAAYIATGERGERREER